MIFDQRREAMAAIVRERFGIDLDRYPQTTVDTLLSLLPEGPCRTDGETLSRVVSACSIGETMFLRHPEQFSALCHLVGSLPSSGRKGLRVWSAGCATGEEAYSLAAVLARLVPAGVHVLATDLNDQSLERARTGLYRPWSMRGVDVAEAEDWLELDGLNVRVRPHLAPLVEFVHHNLVEGGYPTGLDVIFCRNVLLYFAPRAAARVLDAFYESLAPDGVLFLGYCDPAPESDERWHMDWMGRTRFFRKRALRASARPTSRPSAMPARAGPPAPALRARTAPPKERFFELLSLARGLSAQGAFLDALALLDTLVQEHPLEVEPHVLSAMISEEAGLGQAALAAARRALFLIPNEPIAHYLVGSCLLRVGETARAGYHFRLARTQIASREPGEPMPYAEGLTGGQLRRLIDARLVD